MIYKRYYVQIIVRVLILLLFSLAFASLIFTTQHIMPVILTGVCILFITGNLIRYINKTNQYLSNFLLTLKETDGSVSLKDAGAYSPISDLQTYFNEIREIINHVKIEKEKQYHYIQYIIENIEFGILSFDDKGTIELINQSAKQLLRIPVLYTITDLGRVSEGMDRFVMALEPHKPKVYRLNHGDEILQLSMKAGIFSMDGKRITIVSFQDIQNALEDKELDSWQKLIRVLTHEIMNSVTPINTVANGLRRLFMNEKTIKKASELNDVIIEDAIQGLDLIDERGKGLIKFVKKYRSLTRLPEPAFRNMDVETLFHKLNLMFAELFRESNIRFSYHAKEKVTLYADEYLIEQVFINLIKNSIDALSDTVSAEIVIGVARNQKNQTILTLEDNGKGIPCEQINHIFIPFFTTKETGSGIGLALSRQIMRLHKGSITVHSEPDRKTIFYLKF